MAQVVRHLLLVREVWDSNSESIKSPTRYQRLANAATLMCWLWRKPRNWVAYRSLVTPERVLSEYNKDLIFCITPLVVPAVEYCNIT